MCHPRQSKVAARNRRKMSSKLCEILKRRLPMSSSPMRSLSLMRHRVMPKLLHRSDNHPLVSEIFMIHPSFFFDDGRAPAPSCRRVLAVDQSSDERFFFGGRTRASIGVPHRTKHRTRNALLERQTEESLALPATAISKFRVAEARTEKKNKPNARKTILCRTYLTWL